MCEATLEFRNDYLRQRRAVVRVGKLGVLEEKERAAERFVVVHYNVGSRLSQERDVMDVKKKDSALTAGCQIK